VRWASTWYFPPELGLWRHTEVRQLRWEYTFYGDGRCVTCLHLSNAGGPDVAQVRLLAGREAAWSDGAIAAQYHAANLPGQEGQWAWLTCPAGPQAADLLASYARPPAAKILLGRPAGDSQGAQVAGGVFDRREGCYVARAAGGHCRLELTVADTPLPRPVFRIQGDWAGPIVASYAGMPIRPVVRWQNQAMAVMDDVLTSPSIVEFAGPVETWGQ
jgi:hypothetical protein